MSDMPDVIYADTDPDFDDIKEVWYRTPIHMAKEYISAEKAKADKYDVLYRLTKRLYDNLDKPPSLADIAVYIAEEKQRIEAE